MNIKELIKIANEMDRRGLTKEADGLDHIILKLAHDEGLFEDESASEKVRSAIDRSIGMPHYEKTFLTRNPGEESEGSIFSEAQTSDSLKAAEWEPYSHSDISAPAQGYRANIPGTFGIVSLSDLEPNIPAKAVLGHKGEDPFVTVLVDNDDVPKELMETDFTTLLLGPGDDGLIVWTFFPGHPVAPSRMTPSAESEAVETAAEAMALGFDYAKVATL